MSEDLSRAYSLSIASRRMRGTSSECDVITLTDGSSFFVFTGKAAPFQVGLDLEEEDLEWLEEEDAFIRGREWAASFLASREESSGKLYQKLLKREFPQNVSRRIVKHMQELGFQDDTRFAELWIESRLRSHPEGRSHLVAGLVQRGCGSEIARDCVREFVSDQMEDQSLLKYYNKIKDRPSLSSDQIQNRLLRHGFSFSKIKLIMSGEFELDS